MKRVATESKEALTKRNCSSMPFVAITNLTGDYANEASLLMDVLNNFEIGQFASASFTHS
jgi:hypothetical protein